MDAFEFSLLEATAASNDSWACAASGCIASENKVDAAAEAGDGGAAEAPPVFDTCVIRSC